MTKYFCNSYVPPSFLRVNLFEDFLNTFALIRCRHLDA
jgi:hypothetical protein